MILHSEQLPSLHRSRLLSLSPSWHFRAVPWKRRHVLPSLTLRLRSTPRRYRENLSLSVCVPYIFQIYGRYGCTRRWCSRITYLQYRRYGLLVMLPLITELFRNWTG
jgi:hypothetical protein